MKGSDRVWGTERGRKEVPAVWGCPTAPSPSEGFILDLFPALAQVVPAPFTFLPN